MSWSEILNQIQSGSIGNELLVGVHPSYGEEMVVWIMWPMALCEAVTLIRY